MDGSDWATPTNDNYPCPWTFKVHYYPSGEGFRIRGRVDADDAPEGVTCDRCEFIIEYEEGEERDSVEFKVNNFYRGKLTGLCGNKNNNKDDDNDPSLCPGSGEMTLDQLCIEGEHQGN